ncbi:MAG TPA: PAS domain S-box protein [Rubrobacteraceae bacterium]|nr:PAS domain S-box protein [Rubrobacteraceae bacterium]
MRDKRFALLKRSVEDRLLWLGLIVAALYWIIESATDTLVHDETFTERLWPRDPNELWMRFTVVALIVAFSGYAQFFINRQKRIGRSLRDSESRFKGLAEASFEGIVITAEGKVLETNRAFASMFGYDTDEVVGMEAVEFVTAESRELVRRSIFAGSEEPYEVIGLRKDGTCFLAEIRGKMSEYQGRPVRVAAVRDITRSKQIEQELRESEERYRQVFEKNRAVKLLVDPESGDILDANLAAGEYYGYGLEDLKAKNIADLNTLPPDQVHEEMSRAKTDQRGYFIFQHRLSTGEIRDVEVHSSPIEIGGRTVLYSIVHDVTARKAAEEALRVSEERYRLVSRATSETIWDNNLLTGEQVWNGAAETMLGYDLAGGTSGDWWEKRIHPEDRERTIAGIEEVLREGGEVWSDEYRFRRADGTYLTVVDRGYVVRDSEGRPLRVIGSMLDITERKRAEEELKQSEASLAAAQERAHLGSWEWDRRTNELRWSDEHYRIFGHTPQSFVPSYEAHYLDTIHPEDRERVERAIDEALEGELYSIDYRIVRSDGEIRYVHSHGEALFDGDDRESVGMSGTVQDITERQRAEEDLRRAKEEADEANLAKSEFLANMSHEIRTPMNGVIGMTGLLLDTDLTPQQRKYAQTVRNSGDVLLALLDDILDFSKIEAGEVRIEEIDFDLQAVVKDAASVFAERAQEKGLELVSFVEYDVPGALRGDPFRIRQVLTNLLSNAVKFTGEGRVALRVEGVEDLGDEVKVRFEVTDTGIGIDEGQQDNLFQPFSQADTSTTRRYGGTGLGLAICKQLVDLMGGEIGVRSEPGVGSAFFFTLPLKKQPQRVQPAPSSPVTSSVDREDIDEADSEQSGARVLVVEDTLTNQMVAVELLQRRGYHADVVSNGIEAVEAFSRTSYAAILMDIQMPEMDGYEATAEIRKREGLERHTPIIAMTAHALQGDREKALALGMDDYLSKPVRPEQLDKVLERWSPQAPEPREAGRPATNGASVPGDSLDQSVLADLRLIQREGGGDIVERLVSTFLSETPAHLDALRKIAGHGEVHDQGDAQDFKRTAHALNGICRGVGANHMASICAELERLGDSGDLTDAPELLSGLEEEFGRVRVLLDAELLRN